jgi:hypothetical protein
MMTPSETLMSRAALRLRSQGARFIAFTRDKAAHVADGLDFLRVRELAEEHAADEGEACVIVDAELVTETDSGIVWRS